MGKISEGKWQEEFAVGQFDRETERERERESVLRIGSGRYENDSLTERRMNGVFFMELLAV